MPYYMLSYIYYATFCVNRFTNKVLYKSSTIHQLIAYTGMEQLDLFNGADLLQWKMFKLTSCIARHLAFGSVIAKRMTQYDRCNARCTGVIGQ